MYGDDNMGHDDYEEMNTITTHDDVSLRFFIYNIRINII